MSKLDANWFTEIASEGGSALSLAITAKLHSERSPYQQIEVYETSHFERLLVIDGYVMLAGRDNFIYHEMLVHPALYIHEHPARVVIIGGGDCGTLREVLKHRSVASVTQVEIDERVTRVAEQFFPELCESNADARARIEFNDGIAWMKASPPASQDVIIVDSTDPVGPARGLFNEPFYKSCLDALAPGGILVQQSESPLLHRDLMRSMHDHMQAAGFTTTRSLLFPQPVYPSGWWSATLARKDLPLDGFRASDVADKAFETRYYNAAVHKAAFALPTFLQKAL